MGGSCIAGPFGTYLAEPVFNKETIVYAELDMDDRLIAKNVFDCMGHYTRWDIVSLNLREQGWEPIQNASTDTGQPRIDSEKLEKVAKKFKLSRDKLEALLKELDAF